MLMKWVPNTLQQFTEITIPALLQSLIIHRKSLLDILMKPLRRPSAETHSHLRLNTIAESYDHIEIVVNNISLHLTVAFLANRQEILDSSNRIQFPILENILNMQADILLRSIVNLR